MSTHKMKGIFKGFRYISQIFDEEKDDDIQIGFPTDVKHVAHIGWDGPSVESPSWMKEFKSTAGGGFQSAPLGSPGNPPTNPAGEPEVKWVSEDSRRNKAVTDSPGMDAPDVPKASRRHQSADNNPTDSPKKKDPSSRPRHSRRNHSKDSADGSLKSNRQLQELAQGADSPSRGLPPEGTKRSRRKKSKAEEGAGGSSRSRCKAPTSTGGACDIGTPDNDSCSQLPPMQDAEGKKTEF